MRAILERDFLAEVSRGRAFLARSLLAGILTAALLLAATTASSSFRVQPDDLGRVLFVTGALTLLALLALLTPPLVVGSILEERQQGTLSLVLASPVGPGSVAAAKLLARSGAVALGAAAAIPCLSVPLLMGGVPWSSVGALVAGAAAVILEMAAFSVWISSISRRLATAVVLAFLLPALRWTAWGLLFAWAEDASSPALPWVASTFPFGPALEVAEPGLLASTTGFTGGVDYGAAGGFLLAHPSWGALGFSLLMAAGAVAAAGRRLAREEEPPADLLKRLPFVRRRIRRGLPGLDPMLWKETRQLNTATSRPLFYGVLVAMLLLFLVGLGTLWQARAQWAVLGIEFTLLSLVGCVQGAAALGHERTQGSYDLLRASPLTPLSILRGKFVGGLVGLSLLALVPLLQSLATVALGELRLLPTLGGLLLAATVPAFWTLLGMACAVRHPRVRTAVARALGTFAFFLLGIPVLGFVAGFLGILEWRDLRWFEAASPPAMVAGTFRQLNDTSFLDWEQTSWSPGPKALVLSLVLAAAAAVQAWRLPGALARRFEADRERG